MAGDIGCSLAELLEVLPDAKPTPGAGHDDSAHRRVASLRQRRVQPLVHGVVQRVENVRTIERDRQDTAVARELHLRHPSNPKPQGRSRNFSIASFASSFNIDSDSQSRA